MVRAGWKVRERFHASARGVHLACVHFLGRGPQPNTRFASDIVWEVQSPFRFFKKTSAFTLHEKAFEAVRGKADSPLPGNIVWRTERRLNDPDCADKSSPARCLATARKGFERSRLGWAAQTLDSVCYERTSRPFRYPAVCDRQYSWGTAKEDYILPDAHTVDVTLSAERLAEAGTGDCTFAWTPRAGAGKGESVKQSCKKTFVIKRVPYSQDTRVSGVERQGDAARRARARRDRGGGGRARGRGRRLVHVGREQSGPPGHLQRRRARWSTTRSRSPTHARTSSRRATSRSPPRRSNSASPRPTAQFDPKSLPRRKLEDEEKRHDPPPELVRIPDRVRQGAARSGSRPTATARNTAIRSASACAMTLENRHRAVTLVSVACSGADVPGLFMDHDARERAEEPGGAKVPPQLDQLADLICRGGAQGRTQSASYTLPIYKYGSTGISSQTVNKQWCPQANRKRPIDLVLLSIGGNDVGFGALALYAVTESARDLAPIASLVGSEIRFGPEVARAYLASLDKRIKAVRDALVDGFGVEPARVLQNAYEPIQYDETGTYCGAQPTLGMDVHPDAQGQQGAADRSLRGLARPAEAARMHGLDPQPPRLPGRARDRSRHRLPLHHRPRGGFLQARHLRARSDPRADRSGRDEDAAPLAR